MSDKFALCYISKQAFGQAYKAQVIYRSRVFFNKIISGWSCPIYAGDLS